mmetsp:Transcript_30869/g.67419  ORF Transcript_30869/g.67419 Transcript_30869/m.67419 type:complete len:456 (-) Transcript_30869:65-1432(-)
MYGGDEVSAIVLDVGSNTCKGGYAGEDTPKAVFPSSVGVIYKGEEPVTDGDDKRTPNKEESKDGEDAEMKDASATEKPAEAKERERTYYVNQMGFRRDHMEMMGPYGKDGLIKDWDIVEQLWDHTLRKSLMVDPKDHPMLIAEPPHVTRENREKTIELMFEKFEAPAVFLAKNPVLTSFASGKATSLVVDIGGQGTCVTAVHDGYALTKSAVRTPLGGELLTDLMLKSIEKQGANVRPRYSFTREAAGPEAFKVTEKSLPHTTAGYREYCRREIMADMNASVCRVSESTFLESENTNIPTVPYELPDGNVLEVGLERFKVPELLFQPDLMTSFPDTEALLGEDGLPVKGLQGLVLDAIGKCDVDVRKELYGGVLLTGGVSLIPNLRERLERELSEQVSSYTARVKVGTPNPLVERKFSAFIGGSILASLGSFQQMWMSKSEYEEQGANLIHRKCP